MKKKYQKPSMYVECFVLSQVVAENCHLHEETLTFGTPNSGDPTSCGWDDGLGGITWTNNGKCNEYMNENDKIEAGCYHNPSGPFTLFGLS